jgi:hypothetical protein
VDVIAHDHCWVGAGLYPGAEFLPQDYSLAIGSEGNVLQNTCVIKVMGIFLSIFFQ